jgi:hypothetical protein
MDGGYRCCADSSAEERLSPRRQPDTILGGSITRAPNGYRVIPQYTPSYPTPRTVQQIYSNAKQ